MTVQSKASKRLDRPLVLTYKFCWQVTPHLPTPRVFWCLICIITLAFGILGLREEIRLLRLSKGHRTTVGLITGTTHNFHGFVQYSYQVSGREYHKMGPPGRRTGVGTNVTVFYRPEDPTNSSLRNPRAPELPDYAVPVFFLAMGALMFSGAMKWIDLDSFFSRNE